jgi:DNA repair exonuclease SbcCD ATPase subunit
LQYYERFGVLLQEQLDAVVNHAAEVSRDLERQQAEMVAASLRAREEVEVLRMEAQSWQRAAESGRAEAEASEQRRTQLAEESARMRDEIQALGAQRERQRAELSQLTQEFAHERSLLTERSAQLREEAQDIQRHRDELRAEREALEHTVERGRAECMGLAADVARLRDDVRQLEEECQLRQAEASAMVEAAREDASRVLRGVQTRARDIVDRVVGELEALRGPDPGSETEPVDAAQESPADAPIAAERGNPTEDSAASDAEVVNTRLVIRPALQAERLVELRGLLRSARGVVSAEPAPGDDDEGASLLVTHAVSASLLGTILSIEELNFHLRRRGDNFLEIEVLEAS